MSASAITPVTLDSPFSLLPELIARHAIERSAHPALIQDGQKITYQDLDRQVDRVASSLQRDGLKPGDSIAICGKNSIAYAMLYLGALRAGVVVAPLAPSSTPSGLMTMIRDSAARLVFVDKEVDEALATVNAAEQVTVLSMDDSRATQGFSAWLDDGKPQPVSITADMAFNIIYSSGTTGEPKGIVQSHGMRWSHIQRGLVFGYGPECVTLISTPLYSNTTLVSFLVDGQIRRHGLSETRRTASGHPHHAGAGTVSAPDGP